MTKKLNSKLTPEEIDFIVKRAVEQGASTSMREDEVAKGNTIITWGMFPWLDNLRDDWHEDIVLSQDGHRIRIIAILAKDIGKGAFTRLVEAILETDHLVPVVVCPFAKMQAILKRWDWRGIKNEITGESQWFPQKKFKELWKERKRRDAHKKEEERLRDLRSLAWSGSATTITTGPGGGGSGAAHGRGGGGGNYFGSSAATSWNLPPLTGTGFYDDDGY